jgi:CHAT domain-containing protein
LQAAFFAAGARQLLCSLWPVESWVAHSIARRFHEELARQPPELALQITLNDYLDKASSGTRGEYYWAPFFLSRMGTSQPLSKE